jgi:hypothetical protein
MIPYTSLLSLYRSYRLSTCLDLCRPLAVLCQRKRKGISKSPHLQLAEPELLNKVKNALPQSTHDCISSRCPTPYSNNIYVAVASTTDRAAAAAAVIWHSARLIQICLLLSYRRPAAEVLVYGEFESSFSPVFIPSNCTCISLLGAVSTPPSGVILTVCVRIRFLSFTTSIDISNSVSVCLSSATRKITNFGQHFRPVSIVASTRPAFTRPSIM